MNARRAGAMGSWAALGLVLVGALHASAVHAQPVQAADVPPMPPPGLPQELAPVPGGLTADAAAARAIRTSFNVRAAAANVAAAGSARAEAGRALVPGVSLTARYTRLSGITPPAIFGGFTFPVILDQYALRGTVTVPFTDLPLRLAQAYRAAGRLEEARRLDEEAARLQVGAEARVAFYEYLRALGQGAVARQAVETAQRHREDLARFVEAGTVARVELLRVEAQLAESERLEILARNGVALAEAALRQRLHLSAGERVVPGESLEAPVAPPGNLQGLIDRAWHDRPELASLERQDRALDHNLAAARAAMLPSVAGVFNVDVANPNPRFIPQTEEFNTTWDATLQLSWSPTATFVAQATAARLDAQRDALRANLLALREGLELEVRNAWTAAQGARAAIDAARRQLVAAEESYRVRRERFVAGAVVSSDLTDAELDLVRARQALVNANVDLRQTLARLRRAVGEREAP